MVKNLPANIGDLRDVGSITGLERFPGGGHGNPLQYSCLENPMDRGAWQATVHRVANSQTQLKQLNMHSITKVTNRAITEFHKVLPSSSNCTKVAAAWFIFPDYTWTLLLQAHRPRLGMLSPN